MNSNFSRKKKVEESENSIAKIECGDKFSTILMTNGDVYCCGSNFSGQCGLGSIENAIYFQKVFLPLSKRAIYTSCGSRHQFFVLNTGEISSCGFNNGGVLGINDVQCLYTPKILTFKNLFKKITITQVTCNEKRAFILTKKGFVFSCGGISNNSNYDSFGYPFEAKNTPKLIPQRLFQKERIIHIESNCNGTHTFFISEVGNFYCCGDNSCGELGLNFPRLFPIKFIIKTIFDIYKIKDVSCGDKFTLLLRTDGRVFSMGNNNAGQLGIGETHILKWNVFKATEIITFKNVNEFIIKIKATSRNSFFLSKSEKLFACGCNMFNQCNESTKKKFIFFPILIPINIRTDLKFSISGGSEHCMFITKDGGVIVAGSNEKGQIGLSERIEKSKFIKIPFAQKNMLVILWQMKDEYIYVDVIIQTTGIE